MKDITLQAFFKKLSACEDGQEWAYSLLKPRSKMSALWPLLKDKPDYLIWVATREGVFGEKQNRQMTVLFAREVEHLHPICKPTLDVVQAYLDGRATEEELESARAAASAAAWAASAAASAAAWAASAAAWGAAWAAAWAARDAAWAKQSEIIYSFGNPFEASNVD